MMILDPGVPLLRVAAIASMSCLRTLLGLVNRRCVLSLPCALLAHSSLVSVFLALVPHRTDAARGAARTQTAAAAAADIDRKYVTVSSTTAYVSIHTVRYHTRVLVMMYWQVSVWRPAGQVCGHSARGAVPRCDVSAESDASVK